MDEGEIAEFETTMFLIVLTHVMWQNQSHKPFPKPEVSGVTNHTQMVVAYGREFHMLVYLFLPMILMPLN